MKTKICPTCQQSNSSQALICSGCGTVLTTNKTGTVKVPEDFMGVAQAGHLAHISQMYKRSLVLFILDEKDPIIIHNIDKYVILGRPASPGDAMATVDLSDFGAAQLGVSRQHVKITPAYNGYSVQDLSSTNGTWLNEIRLTPHSLYILRNGDQIRLGQMTMNVYFEMSEPVQETIFLIDRDKDTQALSRHALTPADLSTSVTPFLRALSDLQHLVDAILEREPNDIGINRINVSKPGNIISINIDGARDAIELLRHHIMTWRHDNSEILQKREGVLLGLVKELAVHIVQAVSAHNPLEDYAVKEYAGQLLPIIQVLLISSLDMTTEQAVTTQA
jgi:hypothetical protein